MTETTGQDTIMSKNTDDGTRGDHTPDVRECPSRATGAILSPETGTAVPGARVPRRVSAAAYTPPANGGTFTLWDVHLYPLGIDEACWGWMPRKGWSTYYRPAYAAQHGWTHAELAEFESTYGVSTHELWEQEQRDREEWRTLMPWEREPEAHMG